MIKKHGTLTTWMCHGTNSTWLNPTLASRMLLNKILSFVERFIFGGEIVDAFDMFQTIWPRVTIVVTKKHFQLLLYILFLKVLWALFIYSLKLLIEIFSLIFNIICLCNYLSFMHHHFFLSCLWDHVLCLLYFFIFSITKQLWSPLSMTKQGIL